MGLGLPEDKVRIRPAAVIEHNRGIALGSDPRPGLVSGQRFVRGFGRLYEILTLFLERTLTIPAPSPLVRCAESGR
jgi:hypothetical protein